MKQGRKGQEYSSALVSYVISNLWKPTQPFRSQLNVEVGSPAAAGGGWRFMILKVPFNPGHSVIL